MTSLPPEDRPDEIEIEGIDIPVQFEDDPRFEEDRRLWHEARVVAQAAHSVEELVAAVQHPDWRVRVEAIPRLRARWPHDPRTLAALIRLVDEDPESDVRDTAVLYLTEFRYDEVAAVVVRALKDDSEEVRETAAYVLEQIAPEG